MKTFLLLLWSLAAAAALASCGVTIPERVNVPVPIACVPPDKVPARPEIRTEADLMNMPRGLRTLAAWSDKVKLEIYAAELAAIVEGCAQIPRPPP